MKNRLAHHGGALLAALALAGGLAPATRAATDVPVTVSQTTAGGGFPRSLAGVAFSARRPAAYGPAQPEIRIDDSRPGHLLWGVGAAITNTSAWLLEHTLTPAQRAAVLSDLFGPADADLRLVRVTIGGSDFNASGRRYSDDDMPAGSRDPALRHFSLAHEIETIRVLRQALAINPALRVIASPWSAPAWMKRNRSLTNMHHAGDLEPAYLGAYARYLVRYLVAMHRRGIPVLAISVQNEPGVAVSYEGMNLPAPEADLLISHYLRPALRRAGLRTLVLGVDESWDQLPYAQSQVAAHAVDALAWHCYAGDPDLAMPQFGAFPQLMSECAPNLIRSPVASLLSNVFSDGASGALLWNAVLDPSGGPVVKPNTGCRGCTGLVTVDPAGHSFALSRGFGELAQFGQAMRAGSRLIAATRLGSFDGDLTSDRASATLHDLALRDASGSDHLLVYNNTSQDAPFTARWRGLTFSYAVPPGATAAFSWPA